MLSQGKIQTPSRIDLLGGTALRALAIGSFLVASAAPVYAQETQEEQEQSPPESLQSEQEIESGEDAQAGQADTTAATGQDIVVTGSRIPRPNLASPQPVTSVSGSEFFQTGNVSVGDKLAELPQIASTFTQANSTRFLGTAGLNLLDLRGLGITRTLVLQNGRRHVGGDVFLSGVSVDVNTMPTDLIERVDVVTGGNSAVYGSDAIAGVVNFITKRDYEGIMLRGQGGISKYGDAGAYFISGVFGKNFADDRGNIAVNLEYARREASYAPSRRWLEDALIPVDSDPGGAESSDGVPDNVLIPDWRHGSFSSGGTVRFDTGECSSDPAGDPYLCSFIFQPNGDLVPQTGVRVGLGPSGSVIGGNGDNFLCCDQLPITPRLDRYNINLLAHFEISPALVPFVEAKFSRTDSLGGSQSGPVFISGGTLGDPLGFLGGRNRERIYLDNPFLTDQARTVICEQRALSGLGCDLSNDSVALRQSLLGLGTRQEEARRDTFRIVGGIRGDLGSSWKYEVSATYGQLKEDTKVLGNLDIQRFLLANDPVVGPGGNIVCRSQVDPDAAFGYYPWLYGVLFPGGPTPGDPNGAAKLAEDVAQCVPVGPMGGNFTEAQKDYLLYDSVTRGKTKQFDMLAFIAGDSSKWFELPGGPIGFVLGAEYRTDSLTYQEDPLVQLGYTFYNAIPTFTAPKASVKEAFGEIRLPILKDLPLVHELELSAAARASDYKLGSTGTVWAYNGSVIYSPVRGLRLRGNYARAVRAPNQVELFTPLGQNFTPGNWTDPCDVNSIGAGTANRPVNCAAAGVPAGEILTADYGGSIGFLSGGNPELQEETSDSITLGGVLTPEFLPGFSFSADYYSIKIKDVITAPTAQQVFNACYDLASLDNPFCALFERAGAAGQGPNQPFGIINNSLDLTPLNYAKLKARGIDIEVAYRGRIGGLGRLETRFNWTHALELTQFIDPTDPTFGDRLLSELGAGAQPAAPKDAFNWDTSLQRGALTFGYRMRYIGRLTVGTYESAHSFQGRPPQDEDFSERVWLPSRFYHDVRLGIDVGKKYNFYMGVDNLTDTKPPYSASGIGGGSAIYDAIGRFYYAGFVAKF